MRILLVDTDNLSHRAFFAPCHGPAGTVMSYTGTPTNAIVTFSNLLATLIAQVDPARVVFGLEGGCAFRRAIYPEYKAHRPEKPLALRQQLPVIDGLIRQSGVEFLVSDGDECDDVVMSYAHHLRGVADTEVLMATGDKDYSQAVGEYVFLLKPCGGGAWERFDTERVAKEYDVQPNQFAQYLALVGDTVDNIPGVEGVGPGRAVALLAGNPSIDELISRISMKRKMPIDKARTALELSLKLSAFRDIPALVSARGAAPDAAIEVLEQLNCMRAAKIWRRMVERFGLAGTGSAGIDAAPAVAPQVQGELAFA
jgi:DNA polymerase-1